MNTRTLTLTAALIGASTVAHAAGQAPAGQKLSQAECDILWMQVNPSNSGTISETRAKPYVTDFKRANPDHDGTLDKAEFSKACSTGLVSGAASAGAGTGESGSSPR